MTAGKHWTAAEFSDLSSKLITEETLKQMRFALRAAAEQAKELEALKSARPPDGYAVVPVVPTMGMWDDFSAVHSVPFDEFMEAYKAMINGMKVAEYPPCKGKNCGATDGVSHSSECVAEHDTTVNAASQSAAPVSETVMAHELRVMGIFRQALTRISRMKYNDRSTVHEGNAWAKFQGLNRDVCEMFAIADEALLQDIAPAPAADGDAQCSHSDTFEYDGALKCLFCGALALDGKTWELPKGRLAIGVPFRTESAGQTPCRETLSSPGLNASSDSTNGISPLTEAASPDERRVSAQSVPADPAGERAREDEIERICAGQAKQPKMHEELERFLLLEMRRHR